MQGRRLAVLALPLILAVPAAAQREVYTEARTGGNYMHNFYLPPAASTPWRPAFSPDGSEIVFSMAGSLWKIGVDDDTAYELTAETTYDSSPAWSPDGRWIVYTADENYEAINLRLLNVATGETQALTSGPHVHLDPVWAPDGSRVLYVSTAPDGWYQLYSMLDRTTVRPAHRGPPDGGQQLPAIRRLYFGASKICTSNRRFRPNGNEMIFDLEPRHSAGFRSDLARAHREPIRWPKAEMILREETLYRTHPQWSPGRDAHYLQFAPGESIQQSLRSAGRERRRALPVDVRQLGSLRAALVTRW